MLVAPGLALTVALPRPAFAQTTPGLVAAFYEMQEDELNATATNLEDFPTIDKQKPVLTRADATVNIEQTQDPLPGTTLAENFYIRWTGKVRIAKAADYTFYTESDDGSRLFVDGKQVVDNGGLHGAQEANGVVNLTAGDHDIKIEFFEAGSDATMKASWSAEGVDRNIIPANVLFHSEPGKDGLQPGLWGEYYDFNGGAFPKPPADRKPVVKTVDRTVNYEQTPDNFVGTQLSDNFFARWTGKITVPKDGKYTFYTESDDGSRLLIDGNAVVNNGGPHGMTEVSGEVDLTAGAHDIVIEYFEIGGDAGMKASWSGPGVDKEIIPERVLSHDKAAEK